MCNALHLKYPSVLLDFNETRNFCRQFSKNTEILDFAKLVLREQLPSMRVSGNADMTKVVVAFRSFANVPTIAQ